MDVNRYGYYLIYIRQNCQLIIFTDSDSPKLQTRDKIRISNIDSLIIQTWNEVEINIYS